MVSQFNGTSTPKGSHSTKTGDNDCNVNSNGYSLRTALCESIRYQPNKMSDKTWYPGCTTGRLLSCTPKIWGNGNLYAYSWLFDILHNTQETRYTLAAAFRFSNRTRKICGCGPLQKYQYDKLALPITNFCVSWIWTFPPYFSAPNVAQTWNVLLHVLWMI